jgi:hypothetical protein
MTKTGFQKFERKLQLGIIRQKRYLEVIRNRALGLFDNYAQSVVAEEDVAWLVLGTIPVLDPAGFIGLRGNGLNPSKIDDFLSTPLHYGYKY